MTNDMATGSVTSQLTKQQGRAIVSARGNHFVVDSPLALGGPNEEINPIDLLLGAFATCGTFICETAAREMGIPLTSVTVTVAGDFDARGLCNGDINPRVQAFRVRLALSGPTAAQAQALARAFQTRCPIYTTLSRAAPVKLDVVV